MVRLQCPHLALAAPAPQLSRDIKEGGGGVRYVLRHTGSAEYVPVCCGRGTYNNRANQAMSELDFEKQDPIACTGDNKEALGIGLALKDNTKHHQSKGTSPGHIAPPTLKRWGRSQQLNTKGDQPRGE